jgi:hypothetical protein
MAVAVAADTTCTGLWRLDRAAEVGLLHCGWPMGARRASLPRADADPVILLDLPVVCPSGRLTGYVKVRV